MIAAMLLMATPVLATVTITATLASRDTSDPNAVITVSYNCSAGEQIRAFAFDMDVTGGLTIEDINSFHVAESNATELGYGVFPGKFRDYLNAAQPNWVDPCYNPIAPSTDPAAKGGLGTGGITVELGALYTGSYAPASSGTLFKIRVMGASGTTGTLTMSGNATRGGVVNNAGTVVTPAFAYSPSPLTITVQGTCTVPNVVDVPEATATAAITAAGFTVGARSEARSDTIAAGNVTLTVPAAGEATCGTAVAYTVSTGPCVVPNVVNVAEATATAQITAAGFTLGARTTASHCTIPAGNVIQTTPAAGATPGCGTAVAYQVSTGGGVPAAPATVTVPANDPDGGYNVTWSSVAGATSYQLESSAPASGTTVYPLWVQIYSGTATTYAEKVGGGTWTYRVKATNACGSSAYTTGATNCVVAMALKTTATGYADWVKYRYPQCWAFRRQCHGDIEGKKKLVGGYVSSDDLAIFKSVYLLSPTQIAAVPCTTVTVTGRICGFCADLDHKNKLVGGRVSSDDLTIFKTYYLKADAIVTCCDTAAPAADCTLVAGDPFNFWTN